MNIDRLYILLVCNLGASTGVMVTKMKEIAVKSEKLKNVDIRIEAHPAGEIQEYIEDFDVIMVGPQIKHKFAELKKLADEVEKPIQVIDTQDYGTVNGGNILKDAIIMKLESAEK
ncbi:PTS sugar transporter subunit IIB [Oceanobacillus oncorhynchi subsp. incaldanensis]|uniref:PTS sugar transporter subunit IIB n=1 Tax=Oceanobacillus aidingensis TaxID=645964 RepID=A0ABV9JTM6_9BACI|nr:PTS sugar transporter subunit IIB [Oceanobacillus oncorhynchi]MDM8101033.1 PTS sugar transporter subunit IIB [Oceanobacillus oncorhynchi]GIO18982.1 PTS sugar transporter subunit IIB [Oceanobacillus oncorhynchi subsp. incaldanensis]